MTKEWLKKIEKNLEYACNGEISKEMGGRVIVCKYQNGKVTANVASDGTRMLTIRKYIPKTDITLQKVSLESQTDEMVITQSLSGKLEFLHRMGQCPEVRVEQVGKRMGSIRIFGYNDKVKTALYVDIDT